MGLRIILAGATGWAGSELARAIAGSADLERNPMSTGPSWPSAGSVP
ncbi:MAG: hypothetical protein ACOYM2_17105 [Rectinemataceae bacterium]